MKDRFSAFGRVKCLASAGLKCAVFAAVALGLAHDVWANLSGYPDTAPEPVYCSNWEDIRYHLGASPDDSRDFTYARNVILTQDIEIPESAPSPVFPISKGQTVYLDLAGHKITIPSRHLLFSVVSKCSLTLKDSVGGGLITGGDTTVCGGCVDVYGTFIMEGGTIANCKTTSVGGAIGSKANYSLIIMKGGTIRNCSAAEGGGIHTYGRFIMTGGEVINNTATSTSSTAYSVKDSNPTGGGGIGIYSDFEAKIYGGVIAGNTSGSGTAGFGGGIGNNNGPLTIYGGVITNNWAGKRGGGVNTQSGYVTIYGGLITGNKVGSTGTNDKNRYCVNVQQTTGCMLIYGGVFDKQPANINNNFINLADGYAEKLLSGTTYVVGKGTASSISVLTSGTLTGGTFTFDPLEYAACGGFSVDASKVSYWTGTIPKTWTLADSAPADPVYTPTTVSCSSWSEMKTALEAGNNVVLTSDVSGGTTARTHVELGRRQDVSLDLAGHTVTCSSKSRFINVGEGTTFMLKDSVGTGAVQGGTGVIKREGLGETSYPKGVMEHGGCVSVDGTFVFESGTIRDCSVYKLVSTSSSGSGNGGAVYVSPTGSFVMNGGMITNCTGRIGGAAYVEGRLTMNDGLIVGNNATGNAKFAGGGGLAIFSLQDTVIEGGSILANTSAGYAGGIHHGEGNLTIYNCDVRNNVATTRGAGILQSLIGSVTIYGALVKGNTVTTANQKTRRCLDVSYESGLMYIYGGQFDVNPDDANLSSYIFEGYTHQKHGSVDNLWIVKSTVPDPETGGTLCVYGQRMSTTEDGKMKTGRFTFDPLRKEYAAGMALATDSVYVREGHVSNAWDYWPKTWSLTGASTPITVQPKLQLWTKVEVYTNGVLSSVVEPNHNNWRGDWIAATFAAWENEEAHVVYTCDLPETYFGTPEGPRVLCYTNDINTAGVDVKTKVYTWSVGKNIGTYNPERIIDTENGWESQWNPFAKPDILPNWIYDLTRHHVWTNAEGTLVRTRMAKYYWFLGTNLNRTVSCNSYKGADGKSKAPTNYVVTVNENVVKNTKGQINDTVLKRIEAAAAEKVKVQGQGQGGVVGSGAGTAVVGPVLTQAFCELMRPHEATTFEGYEGDNGCNGVLFSNLCAQIGMRLSGKYKDITVQDSAVYFPNNKDGSHAGERMSSDSFWYYSNWGGYKFTRATWPVNEWFDKVDAHYGAGVTNCIAFLDRIPADWTGTCLLPGKESKNATADNPAWKCFDEDVTIDRGDVLMMKSLCHMADVLLKLSRGYDWAGENDAERQQVQQVYENMMKVLHSPLREWRDQNENGVTGRPHAYIDKDETRRGWWNSRFGERVEQVIHDFFHLTPNMFEGIDDTAAMEAARASFREALRCYLDADAFIFGKDKSATGASIVGKRDLEALHLLELEECADEKGADTEGAEWNAKAWRYLAERLWASIENRDVAQELDLVKLGKLSNAHATPAHSDVAPAESIDFSGLGRDGDGKIKFNVHALFDGGLTRALVRNVDAGIGNDWKDEPQSFRSTGTFSWTTGSGTQSLPYDVMEPNYRMRLKLHLGDATLSETLGGLLPEATLLEDLIVMTNRYPTSVENFSGFAKRLEVEKPTRVPAATLAHTTRKVYDRFGNLVEDGLVRTNLAATAVYTAAPGYLFADGSTEKTVTLDTTASPAATSLAEPLEVVATVTTNGVTSEYIDINAAWAACKDQDATLKLLANVDITNVLEKSWCGKGQDLLLDLNGHTLRQTGSDRIITVHGKLSVTNGVITRVSPFKGDCAGIFVRHNDDNEDVLSQLVMRDVTMTNCVATSNGGAIYADRDTQVMLENCTLRQNAAGGSGGAIYTLGNSTDGKDDEEAIKSPWDRLVLVSTVITDNTAVESGAGVYYRHTVTGTKCLVAGTMIRMADGTDKKIEEIEEGEVVRTFDHEGGTNSSARVYYAFKGEGKATPFTLEFEGSVPLARALSIAGGHDLLLKDTLKYVTLTAANAGQYVGKQFYGADGAWHTLTNVKMETEAVSYYSLYTARHQNVYANGMLTVCDDVDYLLNIYELDENLKADAEQLAADVEKYGVMSCEEAASCGMSREWYDAGSTKYLNVAIGKQLVSKAYAEQLFASTGRAAEPTDDGRANTPGLPKIAASGAAGVRALPLAAAPKLTTESNTVDPLEGYPIGKLTLGAGTIITNNLVGTNPNNIYLVSIVDNFISLANDRAGICAGVTIENGAGQFTAFDTAGSTDVALFSSDNAKYAVWYEKSDDGSFLKLAAGSRIDPPSVANTSYKIWQGDTVIAQDEGISVAVDTEVRVVYTANDGYLFADGAKAVDVQVDTSKTVATMTQPADPLEVVATVTTNGETTEYTDITTAWNVAQSGTAAGPATLTLLADIELTDALTVSPEAYLTVFGGALTGAKGPAVVCTNGCLTLKDVTVTGFAAAEKGAVVVGADGVLALAGKTVIDGNAADGRSANLYVETNAVVSVAADDPLDVGARIGVTTAEAPADGAPVPVTEPCDGTARLFFASDAEDFTVETNAQGCVVLATLRKVSDVPVKETEKTETPPAENPDPTAVPEETWSTATNMVSTVVAVNTRALVEDEASKQKLENFVVAAKTVAQPEDEIKVKDEVKVVVKPTGVKTAVGNKVAELTVDVSPIRVLEAMVNGSVTKVETNEIVRGEQPILIEFDVSGFANVPMLIEHDHGGTVLPYVPGDAATLSTFVYDPLAKTVRLQMQEFSEVTIYDKTRVGEDAWAVVYSDGTCDITGTTDMWPADKPGASVLWGSRDHIASVVVTGGVTSVGKNVFAYMKGVRDVTIGGSVTNVEPNAFCFCLNVTNVVIGANVRSVGTNAFARCNSLRTIRFASADVAEACQGSSFKVIAAIRMVDGKPEVACLLPDIVIDGYRKVLKGCAKLGDDWEIIDDPNAIPEKYHFFMYEFVPE